MIKRLIKNKYMLIASLVISFLFIPILAHADIISCGRARTMCTLCDLIAGFNNIIHYIEKIAIGVGLLAFTIAGIMYIISVGDTKMKSSANTVMKNTTIGFFIIFSAWIIINTAITLIGSKGDLGINVTSWGKFNCDAKLSTSSTQSCISKKIKSIDVQCENGSTDSISLASVATDNKPSRYQLKAMATYDCADEKGATSEIITDITQQATWTTSDETVAKTDGGLIQAINLGESTIKLSYQGKNASVNVFVDSCPLSSKTALTEKLNGYEHLNFLSLKTPRAVAASCAICTPKVSEKPTCKFVYGNKDAKYVFVIARVNRSNQLACDNGNKIKTTWDLNDKDEVESYDNVLAFMGEGLKFAGDLANNFAIYSSSKIYNDEESMSSAYVDKDCFKYEIGDYRKNVFAVFVEYGLPSKNKRSHAYLGGHANICYLDAFDLGGALLAHESIGHSFALLDDEYLEDGKSPVSPTANCTKDSLCSKWQSINGKSLGGCYKGCYYSQSLYRSSEKSIMNDLAASKFSDLQLYLIKYMVDHYPNTDLNLMEKIK